MRRPLVRVCPGGRFLFNPPACGFLADQYGAGTRLRVALLFSVETRTVGVRPLAEREAAELPDGALWPAHVQRSLEWPRGVNAPEFVAHYRMACGEYAATLVRGPGPRMLTFTARPLPRPGPGRSPGRGRGLPVPGRAR